MPRILEYGAACKLQTNYMYLLPYSHQTVLVIEIIDEPFLSIIYRTQKPEAKSLDDLLDRLPGQSRMFQVIKHPII